MPGATGRPGVSPSYSPGVGQLPEKEGNGILLDAKLLTLLGEVFVDEAMKID